MDARRARPAVTSCRPCQSRRLHAQALAGLHPPSRGWPHLPVEQRRRARFARHRSRAPRMVIRRLRPGGERAAAIYTLIATAKLNGVDPQAWLADVLRRIADHPVSRLHELLPWHWKLHETRAAAACHIAPSPDAYS